MPNSTRSRTVASRATKPSTEDSSNNDKSPSPSEGEASEAAASSQQRYASAPSTPETVRHVNSASSKAGESQTMFSSPTFKTSRGHRDQGTSETATPAQPPATPMIATPLPTTPMGNDRTREFDQLDLNNMDFADSENDPLMLSSLSAEESPRGRPPISPPRQSTSDLKRPASALRRRTPPPHPYAYQHQFSTSRDPFRRSPGEPFPNTPTGYQRPPPPGYRYTGHGQPSPATGFGRHPRSSPSGYGYPGFPPPPHAYWMSPHIDFDSYPEMDDQIPPPPSDDPNYHAQRTPEKQMSRSPFRSPISSKKFKRSPDSSPHFGPSNSWGMDTPSGTLINEFSPMEPTLNELGETTNFDLNLSRSNSQDSPALIHRAKLTDQSPMNALMHGFSPYEAALRGIVQSPVAQARKEAKGHEPSNPVTASLARGDLPSIRGSSTPSSVRKALWRPESPPSSARGTTLRLEIGGAGSLSTSRALEGINTRLHSRPSSAPRPDTYGRSHVLPRPGPHHFRGDMATPIKSSGLPRHAQPVHPFQGSATKFSSSQPPPSSTPKPLYGPPASAPSSASAEKENQKNSAKTPSSKRIPCNCKKTGCLKLYCICYAAREFCKDCNCTDCFNNEKNKKMVDEAVRQTLAKNRDAFSDKFRNKGTPGNTEAIHGVGCRCKKSECLKKYCECFQAGILCGDKCKCVGCLNKPGSQALIDKRKKIKDQRGFELAVRVADEVWKGTRPVAGAPPPRPVPTAGAASSDRRASSKTTPPMGHMPPPHLMQGKHHSSHPPLPHHGGPPLGHPHHPPPPYHHPMYMRGPPPGYPHMGMAITPAGYGHPPPRHPLHGDSTPHTMYGPPPNHRLPYSAPRRPGLKRHGPTTAPQVTPVSGTPRTPGVRVEFDPASSKKKRKISVGQEEASVPFFGLRYPSQPKTTALAVFSFLSNDDLYNAGLVCKSWSQLAMDDELWKFD